MPLPKTYKEMWERFPNAKFLGLTATPCRLNGKGLLICLTYWCSRGVFLSLSAREDWQHTIS